MLKDLQAKSEAPEPTPVGKSVTYNVNLSDADAVDKAHKLGLMDGLFDDDEEAAEGEEEESEQADETPKRRGYFGD